MLNALTIELLKSRRTRSFSMTLILMVVALLWNLLSLGGQLEEKGLGVLFSNQTLNSLFLPIAISLFTNRIVTNELIGQTFKLQEANGRRRFQIFHAKLLLTALFFLLLALVETGVISLFALSQGVGIPFRVIALQTLGQWLASLTLILFHLGAAMIFDKQGVLLSAGFFGGFLGLILAPKSNALWSFLIPWSGCAYLSPYKFTVIDQTNFSFLVDDRIGLRMVVYTAYVGIIYLGLSQFLKRRR